MSALEEALMLLLLEHNVNMLRVEAEAKSRVLALLILMQKDVVSILANAPAMSDLGKLGKNTILRESNAVIAEYYGKAQLQVDLFGIAEVESIGVKRAIAAAIEHVAPGPVSLEVRLGVSLPTENYLNKLASDVLIQGSPAKNWWLRQAQDTQFKLANEIRIGAAQGETNAQIIKRIVGQDATVAKAPSAPGAVPAIEPGIPGVMPLARKNAAAIVQTSIATVAAEARRATFKANADITNGIMQVSTMDSHTSIVCLAYSGAQWDNDYEPINGNDLPYNGGCPRHINCRSSEISLMKSLREMGIDMDEPDPGMRASSAGPISAKTTMSEFMKMQGEAYQNETLGPGRAALFREGKMTTRDLVSALGKPLKLSDLRARYAQ
jgi:hypothetical protein